MNKIFYYEGKQAVEDILYFRFFKSKKTDKSLLELNKLFKNREVPILPIKADFLMSKYNIPESKKLGSKLKIIEGEWVKNNFKITDHQIESIINN